MGSLTPKLLYIGNPTGSNVYTSNSSTGSYTIIKNINLCNVTGTNSAISLHVLQTGESADNNNKIISNAIVEGNNVSYYNTSIVIPANTAIYVTQASSNISVAISGVEYIA